MDENQLINVSREKTSAFFHNLSANFYKKDNYGYWFSNEDKTIYFRGLKILDDLNIESIDRDFHIVIEDCYINKIHIDRFNYELDLYKSLYNLTIRNSKVDEIFISRTHLFGLHFSTVESEQIMFYSDVNINNLHFNKLLKGTLSFSNVVSDLLEIVDSTLDKTNISKIKTSLLNIFKLETKELNIKNSELKEYKVNESNIGDLTLKSNEIKELGTLSFNPKINNFQIDEKELKKLIIENSYIQNFRWKHERLCVVNIINSFIVNFNFERTILFKDSIFQVNDTFIRNLKISHFSNTAFIYFSGIFRFTNQYNPEQSIDIGVKEIIKEGLLKDSIYTSFEFIFTFSSYTDSTIQFLSSDLGKASFVNCGFEFYDSFLFSNTKMLEIFVSDTKFKYEITTLNEISENSIFESSLVQEQIKNKNEQRRLAYGQFKKVYDNRGDNVTSTEFLALELDAYSKELKARKQLKIGKIKWSEQFNLWLNEFSNNHGNDWWKAVKVTIGINSLFFFIYCMLLGYGFGSDWKKALDLASYSFEYLNPLRKADFIDTTKTDLKPALNFESVKWLARFWDYLSRIIIAYFVYQTIQAFRRFGKTK